MLKYTTTEIVFREIPDETSLAINISGCPIKCPDCHSKELWQDKGKDLSQRALNRLIEENPGITCVAFMGGDLDPDHIGMLALFIHTNYPALKVAWYSGAEKLPPKYKYLMYFDYLKLGPYIKERGPLDNPNTNQKLYKVGERANYILDNGTKGTGTRISDITYKFWNKEPE